MIKYTILYKNGKTWNGKAKGIFAIPVVPCILLVIHCKDGAKKLYYMDGYSWEHFEEMNPSHVYKRTPNPKSKTKKQRAFDEAYGRWIRDWHERGSADITAQAYKKWLFEQRLANQSKFVPPPSPGDRIGYYSSESGKMEWITVKDKDGWITWSGGEMPVAKGIMVHVKYRDGVETICSAGIMGWEEGFEGNVDGRSAVNWKHPHNSIWDIVAYKLYEDPKKVTFIKPIKTPYTFWLGAFGEINDER